MFDDLKIKIDFEYNIFLHFLNAQSRPDIVSRAYEIAFKLAVYRRLVKAIDDGGLKEDSEFYSKMMSSENILDQLYLSAKSKGCLSLDNGDISDKVWNSLIKAVLF